MDSSKLKASCLNQDLLNELPIPERKFRGDVKWRSMKMSLSKQDLKRDR